MEYNDYQNSNNENDYDNEENNNTFSEETEEEIIYNDCIDDDEEEFLEEEEHFESPEKDINKTEKNQNIPKQYLNDELDSIKEEKNEEKIKQQKRKKIKKVKKDIENSKNIQLNQNQNKSQKNKFHAYYSPKFDFAHKKRKKEELKKADDLFSKVIEKAKKQNETNKLYDHKGNTLTTKVIDIFYDKYIGQNGKKIKTIDVMTKMRDEEIRVNRDALKSKENAKKINDLINRQEDFEKLKLNKLKEIEKEISDKIGKECVFMPNGINTSSRTPEDFYNSQLKFIERKEGNINKIYKNIIDNEKKNMNAILTSKVSEKMASAKNPNETKEQFLKRLHDEKLKNVKESLEKPIEIKKLTKEQVNILSNKLYKEGQTFRDNKNKKQKEKLLKELNNKNEELISEKSNKILLDKFINNYKKILLELFDKNGNFQISLDEYKLILNNMGCINSKSPKDDALIKESFNKYLKPTEEKIDTYAFLIFGLAALGLYKGNDEIKQPEIIERTNIENNNYMNLDIDSQKSMNKANNNKNINNTRTKIKTSSELIKIILPNLDLDKYGYTNKTTKIIKQKFAQFLQGLNSSLMGGNARKKQERREKLKEIEKNEESKRFSPGKNVKRDYSNNENKKETSKDKTKNNYGKSNKLEDVYQIIQQKKENDLKTLKAKKEAEELALCTFQPNINKPLNKNKNQIKKDIEKLYQEGKAAYIQKKNMIEHDPEDTSDNNINCTFKPVIRQYNNEIFNKNPLKEEIEKFQKKREQMIKKSYKEFEKPMNFAIESKINKEDIFDRVILDSNTNKNEIFNEYNKKEVAPLLKVEVNLDNKNNTDNIIIYPGDNVKEKTIQFCQKHKLNEEKKNTLLRIILEKIKDNNGNIDKDIYDDEKNKEEKEDNGNEDKKYKDSEEKMEKK